jgi:hypothetical protein
VIALNAALALPAPLPAEAALLLALASGLAAMATLGPAEPPPPEEVTTAAIFALHGHV